MKHTAMAVLLCLATILTFGAPARATGSDLAAWLFEASAKWTPPYALDFPKAFAESQEAHIERRKDIAKGLTQAVADPTMPALFEGKDARARTALFVLAVFRNESHFDIRVQKHHCAGLPAGSCDSGAAYCMGQVHPGDVPELAARAWTGVDLERDTEKCARAVIWRLAAAQRATTQLAPTLRDGDRFTPYATGKVGTSANMRAKYELARAWLASHPAP